MKKLTDEEREELQILNSGAAKYLTDKALMQISLLTPKALTVRMAENERLVLLGGIEQLAMFHASIMERHTSLKKRMEEEINVR